MTAIRVILDINICLHESNQMFPILKYFLQPQTLVLDPQYYASNQFDEISITDSFAYNRAIKKFRNDLERHVIIHFLFAVKTTLKSVSLIFKIKVSEYMHHTQSYYQDIAPAYKFLRIYCQPGLEHKNISSVSKNAHQSTNKALNCTSEESQLTRSLSI